VLTLVDAGPELHELDTALDDLEARLEDVSARLDQIARQLAAPLRPVLSLHADGIAPSACRVTVEPVEPAPTAKRAAPDLPRSDPTPALTTRVGPRRWATAALMAPVLVIGAVFAVCVLPTLAGYRPLVVSGGSMAPTIPLGSLAFTRTERPASVERGDVIVVNVDPDRTARFLHRVERVRIEDDEVLARTRGDANRRADPGWVLLDRDVPKLAWSVPVLGYLLAALVTPLGWVALVLAPAALVCASMLRHIWAGPATAPTPT